VKLDAMRLPYILIFFCLLFLVTTFLRNKIDHKPIFIMVVFGGIVGQLISTVAISLANLFINDGIRRSANYVSHFGIYQMMKTDSVVAFVLGGWFFSIVTFCLSRVVRMYIEKQGRKS
jgi:hypothetical protein